MATIAERDILANVILPAVATNHAVLSPAPVTGFLATRGRLYQQQLMVVGRSVNGFIPGVSPLSLAAPGTAVSFANQVLQSVTVGPCPMMWVSNSWGVAINGYNAKRSTFWRVIREIVNGLGVANAHFQNWPSHLVWSNLYKVAPASGGNPSNTLCNVQLPGCLRLFQTEMLTYLPERLLFLTGLDWAQPFINQMGAQMQTGPNHRYVQVYGRGVHANGQRFRFAVAVHPQGKPEAAWVAEVLRVI